MPLRARKADMFLCRYAEILTPSLVFVVTLYHRRLVEQTHPH